MILYKRTIDSLTEQELDRCVALMRHQRRAQVAKMGNLQVRRRTILGEWMAKTSISEHTGIPIEQIVLNRDAHGKPYVVGPNLHFNVSHSGDLVVCALHDRPIGIDVEQIREINMRLADRLCTPADAAWLAEDFSPRRLLSLWTAKEAYFKWRGTGITNFKSINVQDILTHCEQYEEDGYIISIVI